MRIVKLSCTRLTLPLNDPYRLSHTTIRNFETTIVKIETENTIGIGEATVIPIYAKETANTIKQAIDKISVHLEGKRVLDTEEINETLQKIIPNQFLAKSAVEMAVYDALGKELELPLYDLLGGKYRKNINLVGNIGISSLEKTIELANEFIMNGFDTLKIKIGRNAEEDIRKITAIRELDTKVRVRVDANEAYTFKRALRIANLLEKLDIDLFEQPLPRENLSEMKQLRRAINIPIMADEAVYTIKDFFDVLKNDAADIIKLKVMKTGLLNSKAISIMAQEIGIPCILGNGVQTEIGALAEAHLVVSTSNINPVCECVGPLKMREFITNEGFKTKGSRIELPRSHGIGVTLKNNC